jgi:glycosyltransferase involved in cell wall biosynthesis
MRSELARHKFNNVYVMPNCKELNIIGSGEMPQFTEKPYRLCTFSRVMEEKGIADAVEAVEACNREEGETLFTLDIYGPVVEQEWFDRLMAGRQHCRYVGVVPFNQTTQTLKDYFALLFPTYYHGEGFAGTIIDALSAGLPTIASSWKANAEFIEDGKTGILFTPRSTRELTSILRDVGRHPEKIQAMRHNCLRKANDYQPAAVINTLVDRIK